jgi:hypothetical protein
MRRPGKAPLMGEVQALRANRGRKLDGLVAIVTVARATVADGIVHSLEEGNGRGLRKARLIQRRDLTSPTKECCALRVASTSLSG